jgi:hypothetical protein
MAARILSPLPGNLAVAVIERLPAEDAETRFPCAFSKPSKSRARNRGFQLKTSKNRKKWPFCHPQSKNKGLKSPKTPYVNP